jgi:Helix-turn-helix domain
MFIVNDLSKHLRPRREKLFGDGRPRPLDRNAKAWIIVYAHPFTRRTEKGKHYGLLDVLEALLRGFHNARSGLCFPSRATIAKAAACAPSTVAEAIKALEAFVREHGDALAHHPPSATPEIQKGRTRNHA